MGYKKEKIAIIGAGFTGLAAAFELCEKGYDVTIFETEEKPGGLAVGFKEKRWSWPLERHYHHLFTSDNSIINLAKKVGVKILFKRPRTAMYINGRIHQLDSSLSLLTFPYLAFLDRLRTGIVLLYLRLSPFWKSLEGISAERFLRKTMGEKSWKVLWEPLFKGKFGEFAETIPASWFWARIKKRSASLGYPEGGFENLALRIAEKIRKKGGKFFFKAQVSTIQKKEDKFEVALDRKKYLFDKVICTLPTPLFIKVVKNLPETYIKSLVTLKGFGAVNLVLSLKYKFLNNVYWLNVNDLKLPFLAIVEHTNFMDDKKYDSSKLLYIGNYLPPDHKYFDMTDESLINEFTPFLQKINPSFQRDWIKKAYLFKARFAQPIVPYNFSKMVPKIKTPIKGLYLANIQQVYPWDRGTNYAVELGERVANIIIHGR